MRTARERQGGRMKAEACLPGGRDEDGEVVTDLTGGAEEGWQRKAPIGREAGWVQGKRLRIMRKELDGCTSVHYYVWVTIGPI